MEQIIMNLVELFPIIASFLGSILVMQFKGIRQDLKELNKSVKMLNIEVAEVIKDQSWHKEEIADIKIRLIQLERREK
jgi:hypothetical protein